MTTALHHVRVKKVLFQNFLVWSGSIFRAKCDTQWNVTNLFWEVFLQVSMVALIITKSLKQAMITMQEMADFNSLYGS